MSKLFKAKDWLTVPEAARHLSGVFEEQVTEADVLRLALDGRLTLSVYFVNHAKARCGKVISWDETDWWLFPDSDDFPGGRVNKRVDTVPSAESRPCPKKLEILYSELPANERENHYPLMRSLSIDGERFLNLSDTVITLDGVWDLPMIGGERLDVEHEFQNVTGGPAVTLTNLEGAFVQGQDGLLMCQLQENFDDNEFQRGSNAALEMLKQRIVVEGIKPKQADVLLKKHAENRKVFQEERKSKPAKENYYPAGGMPEDSVLVVRTKALREFEQSINGNSSISPMPLATTERHTLLKQIGALSLALAEQSKKYKRGEKPNGLQIANVAGEIVDALPGANTAGLGVSSIRENIRQGIGLLTAIQQ